VGILRKLILKYSSKGIKTYEEFGDIIVHTTKEIGEVEEPLDDLMLSWLVSFPWAYFEAFFTKKDTWNTSLINAFDNAQKVNGKDCAIISQAFALTSLEALIQNNKKFRKYSFSDIKKRINEKLTFAPLIIERFEEFQDNIASLSPDEQYFEYIYQILLAIYYDPEDVSSIINSLTLDSNLRLAIMTNSVQMITRMAKISSGQKV
jgi:hypothetical protein